jgi:hypothetical protein
MMNVRKLAKVATIGAALFVGHCYMRHRKWSATFSGALARAQYARGRYEYQWRNHRSTSSDLNPRELLEMIWYTVHVFPSDTTGPPEPIQFSWSMTLQPSLYARLLETTAAAAAAATTVVDKECSDADHTKVDVPDQQHVATSDTRDVSREVVAACAPIKPICFFGSVDVNSKQLSDVLPNARCHRDFAMYEEAMIRQPDPRCKWQKIADTDEFCRQDIAYYALRQRLAAESIRIAGLVKEYDRTHFTGRISDYGVWYPFRAFSRRPS